MSEIRDFARAEGLDQQETKILCDQVLALVKGEEDGQMASADEPMPTPKGKGEHAPSGVQPEKYLGSPPPPPPDGDALKSMDGDPMLDEIAATALSVLEKMPVVDAWRRRLGPTMGVVELLEAIGVRPGEFLSAAEVDTIAGELAGRPAYALPDYFRPLVEYEAVRVVASNLIRDLS